MSLTPGPSASAGIDAMKTRLLEIFRRTSFRSSEEAIFSLASGKKSRYYVDCKQALSDPEARALIGSLIFRLVKNEPLDSVGGLELGAYPIATSVSDAIFLQAQRSVRAFVIRKTPKDHGVGNLIAGHIEVGDRTLIVDDVVTSGGSTVQAILGARQSGLHVDHAVVLVDREEDEGRKKIEDQAVRLDALFTLSELRTLKTKNDGRQEQTTADQDGIERGKAGKARIAG